MQHKNANKTSKQATTTLQATCLYLKILNLRDSTLPLPKFPRKLRIGRQGEDSLTHFQGRMRDYCEPDETV